MLLVPELQRTSVGSTGLTAGSPSFSRGALSPRPGDTCPNHPASQTGAAQLMRPQLPSKAPSICRKSPVRPPLAPGSGQGYGDQAGEIHIWTKKARHRSQEPPLPHAPPPGKLQERECIEKEKKKKKCIKPLLLKQNQFTARSPRGLKRGKGSKDGNSP